MAKQPGMKLPGETHGGRNLWPFAWIAGGVLVLALVAVVLGGGGKEDRRREIYRAYYHAGMDAVARAEAEYPTRTLAPDTANDTLAKHHEVYEAVKAAGKRAVVERYGVSDSELDVIEKEGFRSKWPLDPRP